MSVPDHSTLTPIESAQVEAIVALGAAVESIGEAIEKLHPVIVLELRKRDDMIAELRDELHTLSLEVAGIDRRVRQLGADVRQVAS